MKQTHIALVALLMLPGASGWLHHPQQTPAQPAPMPPLIVAKWANPQLLLRTLPRSPSLTSLPSVTPDGRILLFTARQGEEDHTLVSYDFDPKTGILGDSQPFPTDQWKIEGNAKFYVGGEMGDPVPVLSPDGKRVVESLCSGNSELGDVHDPAYIFDRDPMTGRIHYEKDAKTGRLAAKHRLITENELQQIGLPPHTYPVWRNISFSPDSRFVYVPVKTFYNLENVVTRIVQKELNPNSGRYDSPRLIIPFGCSLSRSAARTAAKCTCWLPPRTISSPDRPIGS